MEAEWSATGATGYRLFYTDLETGKIVSADMGSMDQIGAVLAHGTTMTLYVQAYNADGDSPYSEVKSFVIYDPVQGQPPEMLKPEAQPLAIQAAYLDTPVAFLPTEADTTAQDNTVRSKRSRNVYGPEFEDGRISATIHIAPALVHRDLVELSLCLGVADSCEPLLVWNSTKLGYTETILIEDLPNDVEKSVYLELLLPKALVDKLRNQPNEKQDYVIYASDIKSTNAEAKNVQVAKIPIVNLGEINTRAAGTTTGTDSSSSTLDLKISKDYSKGFKNSMFGVALVVTPKLWLYYAAASETKTSGGTSTASNEKTQGAQLGATGSLEATILGHTFNIVGVEGSLIRNSGKRLTRKIAVNVFGATVYTAGQSKKPGASNPASVTKATANNSPSWEKCVDSDKVCSDVPVSSTGDATSAGTQTEEPTSGMEVIYIYEKSIDKSYQKTFMIGWIPVKTRAGISGTAGLAVGANVSIPAGGLTVSSSSGPKGNISAYAEAGVTILIVSAGVGITLTLVSSELQINVTGNLKLKPLSKPTFFGDVSYILTGPEGHIYVWAEYTVPAWSLPPWKTKRVTKNLATWRSFIKTYVLYKWGTDGKQVDGATDSPDSTSTGDPVAEFYDREPTAAEVAANGGGWVCVYKTGKHTVPVYADPVADEIPKACFAKESKPDIQYSPVIKTELIPSCTRIPDAPEGQPDYQEVAFNISGMNRNSENHGKKCPTPTDDALVDVLATMRTIYLEYFYELWSDLKFEDNIEKIKIWGPVRVTLFENESLKGSSAYFYARTGQVKEINLPTGYFMRGKSESMLLTRIGVQDKTPNPANLTACFYKDKNQGGTSLCPTTNQPDLKSTGLSDKISSVKLTGFGTVCLYANPNYDGYQSCYQGKGYSSPFNLKDNGMGDRAGSIKFMPTPLVLALADDLNGSLEENGTSSLPNSGMVSAGRLDGYIGGSDRKTVVDISDHKNDASVATVQGPGTILMYASSDKNNGKRATFYLDSDMWDITYLHGINDDVDSVITTNINCLDPANLNSTGCAIYNKQQ